MHAPVDLGQPCRNFQVGSPMVFRDSRAGTIARLCRLLDRGLATGALMPEGTVYVEAGSHLYRIGP